MTTNKKKTIRAVHRPVSIIVEKITHMPAERILPEQTDLTINIKLTREKAEELIKFLQKDLEASRKDIEWFIVTVTGFTP